MSASGARAGLDSGVFDSASAAETEELGRRLGSRLKRGEIVLLSGDLGTGKTTFARGVCRALGVSEPVTSPTFTIGRLYRGRDEEGRSLPVSHLDLYRLSSLDEEDSGLIEDYFEDDGIVLLEWPEVSGAPMQGRATRRVQLDYSGGDRRRITLA